MYSVSGLRRGLGLLAALLLPLQSAMAQDVATVGAQDSERWFGDARAAIDKGDLPGAVSALERILLTNPDLANIKLELGLLYLRLGHADSPLEFVQGSLQIRVGLKRFWRFWRFDLAHKQSGLSCALVFGQVVRMFRPRRRRKTPSLLQARRPPVPERLPTRR